MTEAKKEKRCPVTLNGEHEFSLDLIYTPQLSDADIRRLQTEGGQIIIAALAECVRCMNIINTETGESETYHDYSPLHTSNVKKSSE